MSWRGLEDQRDAVIRFLSRRCRDEHEAEDLTQETLMRAARYRSGGGERGRLTSWLVQIAANVLRDHARREGRGPKNGEDELMEQVMDPHPSPGDRKMEGTVELGEHPVDTEDALHHLNVAFTRLLERDRAVLSAYYGAGEDTAHAARECGIRQSLVKVRLFRARRRLERLVLQRASQDRVRQVALPA